MLGFVLFYAVGGCWVLDLPAQARAAVAFSVVVLFSGPGLAFVADKPGLLLLSSLVTAALIAFMWSGHANPASAQQRKRVAVFSISFTSLLLAIVLAYPPLALEHGAIETERNFYGVLSVVSDTSGGSPRRVLHHGKITHGFQFLRGFEVETNTHQLLHAPEWHRVGPLRIFLTARPEGPSASA